MEINSQSVTRSVPLTVLVGLGVQAVAIIWSASMMYSNIQANANEIAKISTRTLALETAVQGQAVSLGRIDENIKAIRASVEKMALAQMK
jgi:hypothetical protein|tara:strand:+ start:340 stop:609 length:270 start_codon:yes stop_codon:yes gene_type:complete